MGHQLFPENVKLDPESHVYSDDNNQNYMGFSSVFNFIGKEFFAGLHKTVAFSEGIDPSEVRARWDAQREDGNRIDDCLTEYAKTGKLGDENQDLLDAVKQILPYYSEYNKTFEQLIVYNEKYKTATAIDKLSLCTNRKDSPFVTSDFKAFEKMDLMRHNGWLKAPFDYLPDSKFIKIAFQLSYGSYHFEKLTGKRCKQQFIHLVKPSTCKKVGDEEVKVEQQIIQVPYMKLEIELLLSTFADEIKTKLAEQKQNKELNILDLI